MKYMKKCSTYLARREMQIKTTFGFYLTPVSLAIIKKKKITNVVEDVRVEEEETLTLLVGM
jgi:hypothetical protein